MTVRTWVSAKLLDLAEGLPAAQRGPLSHLQLVRSFQRKHAAEPHSKGSPPGVSRLSLPLIRLAEAYSIESFDRVSATLQRLFPGNTHQDHYGSRLDNVDASLRSLAASSWWRIGTLLRDKRPYISQPVSVIPELPTSVDYVTVALHHILPSVAVLTLDVHLSEQASDELTDVQAAPYLSEVTLQSLFRWRAGHVEVPVMSVRQRYVRIWLDCLRAGIEIALKGHLGLGMFGSVATERPRLPAVEVYCIHGDADLDSRDWQIQARWWLESYGIEFGTHSYRSVDALFQWPRNEHYRNVISGHILLISLDKYLTRIGNVETYGGADNALRHRVEQELDDLISAIVVTQILEQARKVTEELRQRVFRRIEAGIRGFRLKRLTLPTGLHTELLRQSIILSRLKAEFLREEGWFAHRVRSWNRLKFASGISGEDGAMDKHAVQRIHLECETVQAHLDLAREAFGKYYTAHNTRAIFWLTIAVLVLTAVVFG